MNMKLSLIYPRGERQTDEHAERADDDDDDRLPLAQAGPPVQHAGHQRLDERELGVETCSKMEERLNHV